MRYLLLLIALSGCAGSSKVPCTEESLNALRVLYSHAAKDVIERGDCDKYQRVEECPAYALIEKHFELAGKAMCLGS